MKRNIKQYIKSIISSNGYIKLDIFLSLVSSYYYSNNPIGKKYDFITAPEISQMFGEIIGIYVVKNWLDNIQQPFTLVELGPGNGTMMFDIIKTIQSYPQIYKAIEKISLIETSDFLRKKQKQKLCYFTEIADKITWHNHLLEINASDIFIIGNEFFDALPIKQFYLKKGKLYEVVITMVDNKLSFSLMPSYYPISLLKDIKEDGFVEASPQREEYMKLIAKKLSNGIGHGLVIDYGYIKFPNTSTLQAVKNHKKVSVLENVGQADITSLVDFNNLGNVLSQYNFSYEVITQGDFLKKWGIEIRAEKLKSLEATSNKITKAVDRLTSPSEMGGLFKVLSFNTK